MTRLLLLLLFTTPALAFIAESPGALEGANIPDGPFLAVASHNCQPMPLGTVNPPAFTRAMAFIVAPQTAAGKGFIAETACQFHADNALPALAPGRYEVAGSQCPPDLAAVVTRWQTTLVPYAGGGDGGCDEAGALSPATTTTTTILVPVPGRAAPLPLSSQTLAKKPRRLAQTWTGRCTFAKGKQPSCTWKGLVPDDLKRFK